MSDHMTPRAARILDELRHDAPAGVREFPAPISRQAFEDACELRFRERAGITAESARFFAKTAVAELLDGYGVVYGAPGFLWTASAARDLADAEMKLWEETP